MHVGVDSSRHEDFVSRVSGVYGFLDADIVTAAAQAHSDDITCLQQRTLVRALCGRGMGRRQRRPTQQPQQG
jgi:hypothetical protein